MFGGFGGNGSGGGVGSGPNSSSTFGSMSAFSAPQPPAGNNGRFSSDPITNQLLKPRGGGQLRGNSNSRGGFNNGGSGRAGNMSVSFHTGALNSNNAFNGSPAQASVFSGNQRGGGFSRGRGRGNFRGGKQNHQQQQQAKNVFQNRPTIPSPGTGNLTAPGFKPRTRPSQEVPAFLLHGSASVKQLEWKQDPWDVSNQRAMSRVEQQFANGSDMQGLYEQVS